VGGDRARERWEEEGVDVRVEDRGRGVREEFTDGSACVHRWVDEKGKEEDAQGEKAQGDERGGCGGRGRGDGERTGADADAAGTDDGGQGGGGIKGEIKVKEGWQEEVDRSSHRRITTLIIRWNLAREMCNNKRNIRTHTCTHTREETRVIRRATSRVRHGIVRNNRTRFRALFFLIDIQWYYMRKQYALPSPSRHSRGRSPGTSGTSRHATNTPASRTHTNALKRTVIMLSTKLTLGAIAALALVGGSNAAAMELTDATFDAEVASSGKSSFVKFYAPWYV